MFGISQLIGSIIIGAIAGYLASIVVGTNEQQGCIADIIVGVIGGFIGRNVIALVLPDGVTGVRLLDTIIFATLGAVLLLIALQFLVPGRRRRRRKRRK